jgi:hypothetical protein
MADYTGFWSVFSCHKSCSPLHLNLRDKIYGRNEVNQAGGPN